MSPLARTTTRLTLAVGLAGLSLAATACGPEQQAVCEGKPEHVVVVPSTSESEYETSLRLTPDVVRQAVARVSSSCGRLTVGIMTDNPERDLELRSRRFVPTETSAYNPAPMRRNLIERVERFASKNLLGPLERTQATRGSPFLTAYAKVGRELETHRWRPGILISIGDGLLVDRSPNGRATVRLDRGPAPPASALDAFVPMLKSLSGSCVILAGQGATDEAGPSPARIRVAERLLRRTLNRAGVGFVATRSRDLPPGCETQSVHASANRWRESNTWGSLGPEPGSHRTVAGAGGLAQATHMKERSDG